MANKVTPTPYFIRRAKRLIKKFHTLDIFDKSEESTITKSVIQNMIDQLGA